MERRPGEGSPNGRRSPYTDEPIQRAGGRRGALCKAKKRQQSHPVDFYCQRFRFSLRFRFGCGVPADLTGSCRTVGSPFPPPRLATIDCAISTAKAANRLSTGLRLHMRLPYGGGYAGHDQPSCNRSESRTDSTNLTVARVGQVAVALTDSHAGSRSPVSSLWPGALL